MLRALSMHGVVPSAVALLAVGLMQSVPGSERPPQVSSAFRSDVELVALTVTVTDDKHRFVSDLSPKDFSIEEDGVPQTVSVFAEDRAPLDLAVMIDTSGSMAPVIGTAQQAAGGLVHATHPGDRTMVVAINNRPDILSQLSDNPAQAVDAISHTHAGGNTALYTSLYVTLREMQTDTQDSPTTRRQAVALLSDGRDTASIVAYDEVMELARESGICIYSILLTSDPGTGSSAWAMLGDDEWPTAQYVMKSFADETGGRLFVAHRSGELGDIYRAIADDLDAQYLVGYVSTNPMHDGSYRHLSVHIVGRPTAVARTKSGYQAARSRS